MLSPISDSSTDADIKQLMTYHYDSSYTASSAFWREAEIDKRFKIGDQNFLNSYGQRNNVSFNYIRRQTNMIEGYQRQNRKSSALIAVEDKDQKLSDQWTKLSLWSERREGFHEYFSQAFGGALDTGLSLLHLYNDFTTDPVSGDLMCDNVSYNNFMIDPFFRKQDLSDCNFVWRRKWVSKQKAKQLLPQMAEEIEKMRPDGVKDGRFPIQAEALYSQNSKLFTYDEFHYMDTRPSTIVVDTKTGETMEWEENPDDDKNEMELTLSQQPWLRIKKIQKPTVKLAIVLSGKVMYSGTNLLNVDRYPFIPILCYHEPDVANSAWRFQGIVRNLRDSQFLFNRRRVIELDILESQINSGYKYKVGSVTDEKVFRQTGQGFLIPMNSNSEMSDVERIDPPGIPQSMTELSRSLADDISKISGVNEELLGSATDDKSGILSMLRQGAGLTTLQTIFDKLDYSQKLFVSLRNEAIRKNWSNGKIRNIIGEQPDERLRLTNTQKFDVAVEQGSYSITQKQMELKQLIYFRELGVAISDEDLLQASTMQNKSKIIERHNQSKQQQQEQQEQQMQMEAQRQEQSAANQRMLDYSKSKLDMASAKDKEASAFEKISKIDDNKAQAEESRTQAELNLVKTLIELEDMDLRQLKESIAMADILKAKHQADVQQSEIQQVYQDQPPVVSEPVPGLEPGLEPQLNPQGDLI